SYDSDVDRVTRLLLQAARSHPQVLPSPEPEVVFQAFGESSLQFDLGVWVGEPKWGGKVLSDLRYQIHRLFKENRIEMPFPQREVRLKGPLPPSGVTPPPPE
ncbi:MAG TPA: hypothetical protein VIK48_06070, partial [Candidatus Manganitrophaceae bacterium]